jgi:ribosomal-protein-serine acetyltransferase
MTWPPKTKSPEDTESFIKFCLTGLSENKELACGIQYNGRLVGVITLNEINQDLKKVIIGYWVSAEFQRQGFITKSCKALIEYAFDQLSMAKIQIHVATENIPSQKVCERLGFHLEGTIKNSENLHGKIVDHNIYGLMKVDSSKSRSPVSS